MAETKTTTVKPAAKKRTKKSPIEILAKEKEAEFPIKDKKEELCVRPKKKILFVASEATPFIATGGLAEVIGLALQSARKGSDLRRKSGAASLFGHQDGISPQNVFPRKYFRTVILAESVLRDLFL